MCGTSTKTTDSSQQTLIPDWMSQQAQNLSTRAAMNAVRSPYQGYTGPTEAAFGPTFGTATTDATSRAGTTDSSFTAGQGALTTGLGQAATDATTPISDLMSQYTQAALNPQLRAIQQQAATSNQGLAQGATMAGAFGDTGYGAQKANLARDTTNAISDATGSAYNTAYNNALQTHQNALTSLLGGVNQASGLGSATTGAATSLDSLLGTLGSTQQQAGQTGINTAINVNQSNQMGQLGKLQAAAGVLSSAPHDVNTYGSSTTTQPDNTGFGLLGSLVSAVPGIKGLSL